MKITAQEEYGIRCMLQLIRLGGERAPVQVPAVAQAEGLSVPYAEKLMRVLAQGGLVESVRGSKGGFRLAKPLQSISLGDVMRALGDLPEANQICSQYTGSLDTCTHTSRCTMRPVWHRVALYLTDFFESIPLASLVETPPVFDEPLVRVSVAKRRPQPVQTDT